MQRSIVVAMTLVALALAPAGVLHADPAPQISEPLLATVIGGKVRLTGSDLGSSGSRTLTILDASDVVQATLTPEQTDVWTSSEIVFDAPLGVDSGSLYVTVDGTDSNPIDLEIWGYAEHDLSPATNPASPLAIAIAPDGTAWVDEEFHTHFRWMTSAVPPVVSNRAIPLPAPPADKIFSLFGFASNISTLGEDVDVENNDSIWFTQGGDANPPAGLHNTSRIIQYVPSTDTFRCYNAALDNSEAMGVLIDGDTIWYAQASLNDSAIMNFNRATATSSCTNATRPPLCSAQPANPSCHNKYALPRPGSPAHLTLDPSGEHVWFTEFWQSPVGSPHIGRLEIATGSILELPLPPGTDQVGPGAFVGSGPWELAFDSSGDLWVNEGFDVSVLRVQPQLMEPPTNLDCSVLVAGENPCVTEVFAGSDGTDGHWGHSLSVGINDRVWFAHMEPGPGMHGIGRISFVSEEHGGVVVSLPPFPMMNFAQVEQDLVTGDVWAVKFDDNQLLRLRLNDDMDGVDDASDNCPAVYNPSQLSSPDGDGVADACDTDDDNDGMPDWFERQTTCLNQLVNDASGDPDGDTVSSLTEMGNGTMPCDDDTDNDGFKDRPSVSHQGPANTNHAEDNCPTASNGSQANFDGNFIDQTPPSTQDDTTLIRSDALGDPCDTDDDNDGLLDFWQEGLLLPCPSASATTNPLKLDTDGDRAHDGVECAYGTDPNNAASKPPMPTPGQDPDNDRLTTLIEVLLGTDPNDVDTDNDKIQDGSEYKGYNSNPLNTDTDGDGKSDGCEVASINTAPAVNSADQGLMAAEMLREPNQALRFWNMDLNKDGNVNSADQGLMAAFISPPGQCS